VEGNGGSKPINAKSETIAKLRSFRAAYAKRRCIVPVNNFFEWRKLKPPKTPYAIGMKDGSPFGFAGFGKAGRIP
jgi:putative SOS response-associated peptidase YedK